MANDEKSALKEELTRCREENLRLRDQLIGLEAELGTARGRAAELQDHATRSTNALRRIQTVVPGFAWSLLARLRGWRA